MTPCRSAGRCVKSSVLHVIGLAEFILARAWSWAEESVNPRLRKDAELDRARHEIALLREEIRIKDARMAQVLPQHRPHYPQQERMAILQLRAARNWSAEQTVRTFLVSGATIAHWMKRLDEEGPDALVQVPEPVNRFPRQYIDVVTALGWRNPDIR